MLLQKPVSRLVIVAPVLLELVAGDEIIRSEAEYFSA
jgi:hypothetical protein